MLRAALGHRLFKNASALVALQVFNYLAPLVVLIHLTYVLGVELYGVVAFSVGLTQFSFVILDFGFSISATQKISQYRENRRYIGRLTGSILAIKLILFFFVAFAITLYIFKSSKYEDYRMLFLLTLFPILGQAYQPIWFFSGLERMGLVAASGIISRLLFVIFIVSFVRAPEEHLLVPIGNGIAQICAAVFSFTIFFRLGFRIVRPKPGDIRYTLKMTAGYFISRLSVATYMNGGVLILGFLSTPVSTAVYSMAEQIYRVMQSAFSPVSQSLFPYMVKEKNIDLWARTSLICLLVAAVGSFSGYFLSPYLIPMVFGSDWGEVLPVLNVFFIAIIIHVSALFFGYPLAAVINRVDVANRSVLYGLFVYLWGVLALIVLGMVNPVQVVGVMVISEAAVLKNRLFNFLPLLRGR